MDRRPVLALAVALSLVLSGCGAVPDTDTTREPFSVEQPTDSTPVPRDAPDRDGAVVRFSPDAEADQFDEVAVFLNSQSDRLSDTSYRFDYVHEQRTADGTVLRRHTTSGTFARNDSRYVVTRTTTGERVAVNQTNLFYGNGTRLLTGTVTPGRSSTENASIRVARNGDGSALRPDTYPVFRGRSPEFVYTTFSAMNVTTVEELDRAPGGVDDQLFWMQATRIEDSALLLESVAPALARQNGTEVESATLDAIVSRTGFVLEFDQTVQVRTAEGKTLLVRQQLVYRDVGTATVTPPTWADLNNSTRPNDG